MGKKVDKKSERREENFRVKITPQTGIEWKEIFIVLERK